MVPEFYCLPELFLNIDHCPFGQSQDETPVHHVKLPPYALDSPYRFVSLMRQALESAIVSESLHLWVDLIWGYK